ncbi:MAG: cation:proton antiporter [Actinomycetota bacterium]
MDLNPPTEHQLLVFWVALLLILVAARLLGAVMQRVGQPAVIGELAAGLLLGPSVLGKIAPDVTDWLFPADDVQTGMLFTIGWIGVLFLLVSTGFETDLGLIQRLGRAAVIVSAGSLVVPAAAGFAVGWLIPTAFVGGDTERYIFALFIAAALSISSLPVIAKILGEMGLMRRNFGQLTLAAGMANDVIGWVALGLIAGLAQAGGLKLDKLAFTVIGLIVFFVVAFTIGQVAVDRALKRVRATGGDSLAGMTVVVITALSFGVVTQWLHVEAVLGAFIAGVILARSRFADHELIRPLETMTAAVFAPIFFATAGLRVDLGLLADGETILWALIVLAVASASKFLGSILGAQLSFLPLREGAALGVGLNARGALEIVIATVGLSLGVLNDRSYTVVVLMAMATSMAAPPLLRRTLKGWEGTPEERQRLDMEAQLASNIVVRGGRVLIPTKGDTPSLLAAQVAGLTWPIETQMTLLTAGDGSTIDVRAHQDVLHGRTVDHEIVDAPVAEAVVNEALLGYDAIVIGAPTGADSAYVTEIIRRSPIPVVVVRSGASADGRLPWAFARAIVPVNGSRSSKPALELATQLSSNLGTQLLQLHVTPDPATRFENFLGEKRAPQRSRHRAILDEAATVADVSGARASSILAHDASPARGILATAVELGADLIVMSGTSRDNDGVLAVSATIQHVLDEAQTTLVVVLAPEAPGSDSGGGH